MTPWYVLVYSTKSNSCPNHNRFSLTCPSQNWPSWLKWAVLIQVGFMAFLGPYNAALINPSLVLLSDAIDVSSQTAAYTTTTAIIIGGVSPFIWTPLTNYYGRRPITLLAILLTILGGVGSGASSTFNQLIGTRAMCGFGFGGMMSVGTACVNDMFFLHERGEKTGVYSIFVTNGAHVAALSRLRFSRLHLSSAPMHLIPRILVVHIAGSCAASLHTSRNILDLLCNIQNIDLRIMLTKLQLEVS